MSRATDWRIHEKQRQGEAKLRNSMTEQWLSSELTDEQRHGKVKLCADMIRRWISTVLFAKALIGNAITSNGIVQLGSGLEANQGHRKGTASHSTETALL